MSFRFLHSADWQIGKPFRSFGDRLGAILQEARLDAIDRLATAARDHGARHVLVAGDVFDGEDLARPVIGQALERLRTAPDLTWHLLPGNHDPARPGGIWDRIARWGLPANVKPYLVAGPVRLADRIWLLAAPLTSKSASFDPTAAFDEMATPADDLRIGLAHGSVKDFAGTGAAKSGASPVQAAGGPHAGRARLDTIDPRRAASAGLAYLALGDWHGMTRVDAQTWYSGTPEPDGYLDNAPGHALAVSVDAAASPIVTAVATAHHTWCAGRVTISSLADLEAAGEAFAGRVPRSDRLLLRLTLDGTVNIEDRAGIEPWRENMAARLRHIALDLTALTVRRDADPAALFARDNGLARVAARLTDRAASPEPSERTVAETALVQLLHIVRELEEDAAA